MKRETQRSKVKKHLESGLPITPMDALERYGCFRLAAVILNLKKDGHNIVTHIIKKNKKRFAQYYYASETKIN